MKLDIVITAFGHQKKFRALQVVEGEASIQRQVRQLSSTFPGARIIVVSSVEIDRLRRLLPPHVKLVELAEPGANGARHVARGVIAGRLSYPVMVVSADQVFDGGFAADTNLALSASLIGRRTIRHEELGVVLANGVITRFSYGVPEVWSHSFLLTPADKSVFVDLALSKRCVHFLPHEVLNILLDMNISILGLPLSEPKRTVDVLQNAAIL